MKMNMNAKGMAAVVGAAILAAGAGEAQLASSPWPSSYHDARNSCRSTVAGPAGGIGLAWSYHTVRELDGAVIGGDGSFYFTDYACDMYALTSSGSSMWQRSIGSYNWGPYTNLLDAQGRIYTQGDLLQVLDSSGNLAWSYAGSSSNVTSLAMGADGTVYEGKVEWTSGVVTDSRLYAMGPTGALSWSYEIAGSAQKGWVSTPACAADGRVCISSQDIVYSLNASGTLAWSYRMGRLTSGAQTVVRDDGTTYVASKDRNVYAIGSSGTLEWSYCVTSGGDYLYSMACGADGRLQAMSWNGTMWAIGPTGAFLWSYSTGAESYSLVAIDGGGTVYSGNRDGLFCWTPSGALTWSTPTESAPGSYLMAIDGSGRLCVDVMGGDDTPGALCVYDNPARPVITGCARDGSSSPAGDITVTWAGQAGSTYRIYAASSPGGPFEEVDSVVSAGAEATWRDDGSRTGAHPSTVEARYYRVALDGGTYAADTAGMRRLSMGYLAAQNAYSTASLPLIPLYDGAAPDVNEVIGNQGHAHSLRGLADKIFLFNPATQSLDRYLWNHNGTWEGYPSGTPTTLDPSRGFAFMYQNSEKTKSQEIVFTGVVARAGDVANLIDGRGAATSVFSFVGYNYPLAEPPADSHILEDGFVGRTLRGLSDKVYLFDFGSQSFLGYAWHDTTAWRYENVPAFDLAPGSAYLVQNRNSVDGWTWNVTAPAGY